MLFLDVGDFEKCWILNSAACRTCVALGGQSFVERAADLDLPQSQEIRASIFCCYIFDKSFSINIDRPSCLPDIDLGIANLALPSDNEVAYEICTVLLKIGNAMDALIKERKSTSEGREVAEKIQRLHGILDSLNSVHKFVERVRKPSLIQAILWCLRN